MKKKVLIVGSGGREGAFALKLMEDSVVYAVVSHKNPTIVDTVKKTGGGYTVGNVSDPPTICQFAQKHQVDYAFVSADDPLAHGVVDGLLAAGIKAIGGTKAAARIEWDKVYAMEMIKKVCPEHTPFFQAVSNPLELAEAVRGFEDKGMELVVKPQGLTGGKGVKVMPEHLKSYDEAVEYATTLLQARPQEKVLLVEKLHGLEFTIMGITDGEHLVSAPATYDYPFRLAGDLGPGTGGMGCFTAKGKKLPFMDDQDLQDCQNIMESVLKAMKHDGLRFNGVLNGGFFKTAKGIQFMEFNSRFGDPEALNVLMTLEGSFAQLMKHLWEKTLSEVPVSFQQRASVVKYLVASEYPETSQEALDFVVNEEAIRGMGVSLWYAACVKTGVHTYQTLKKSRVVALGAVAEKAEDASDLVNEAIARHVSGELAYRADIGSKESLDSLTLPWAGGAKKTVI